MFRHKFQSGLFSILYSIGSKPLQIWDKKVRNGHIKRITDNDIQSLVLEMEGTNVSTTYITCPADSTKTLGIKLPIIILVVKNLKKYFTFEIKILDDENMQRRFRASNYRSTTSVNPFICTMPMRLDDGWNQIQFNLADLTRRAYGTNYIETLRVQIHANCRIRRVYFSDRLFSEDELPAEFKLYLPVQNKAKVSAQPQDISMEPGVSVSLGPEQSKGTEPEPGTVKDLEPGMSTEPEAGTSTEPEQGMSTEPGASLEPGTSTELEPGTSTELEPVTSTELEPVTSTEPDIKVEPGTNTEGELGMSTELEPSKE